MNRFVLIVEFQVKPGCLEKFNEAIAINAKASVADEPGCRQFDVLHNQDDPHHIVLYEVYDDEAAFRDDHMKRSHTQTFLAPGEGAGHQADGVQAAPAGGAAGQAVTLRLRVKTATWEAPSIVSYDLRPLEAGDLPAFSAGAHIDLTLSNGLIRSYSLHQSRSRSATVT